MGLPGLTAGATSKLLELRPWDEALHAGRISASKLIPRRLASALAGLPLVNFVMPFHSESVVGSIQICIPNGIESVG